MTDLKAAAEAAKAAVWPSTEYIETTNEFQRLATPDAVLALYAERDEARADFEQAADWNKIVDEAELDRFDDIADKWLAMDAIQRLHNAVTSVFAKWSNDQIMARFKEHMTNVMHQSFVEGAICGVRASKARAEAAEAALSAAQEEVARYKRKLMQGEAILAGWTRIDRIKLAAGEMTAQEARTALAVAKAIASLYASPRPEAVGEDGG